MLVATRKAMLRILPVTNLRHVSSIDSSDAEQCSKEDVAIVRLNASYGA
jgi:hypothetical protein